MEKLTTVECAICAGYGVTTICPRDDAHEIEHDAARDSLPERQVYACDECLTQCADYAEAVRS